MLWLVFLVLFVLAFPKVKYLFRTQCCLWSGAPLTWLQTCSFLGVYDFARYWHDYEVHGLDELRKYDGNCLLVGYHSRCTVDLVYLLVAIQPGVIATHMMFKIPMMGWLLSQVNILPSGANSEAEKGFVDALSSQRPVLLLPGGVYECLKPLSEMGKLQWKEVPGFARIIHHEKERLGSKTKVIPFYTRNCEDSMHRSDTVYEVLGRWSCGMYDAFRRGHVWFAPVMLTIMFVSVGMKLLPRPVKLDTYLGDPVVLREGQSAEDFAARVREATQALIDRVEALPVAETQFDRLRRSKAPADRVRLFRLCTEMLFVGLYTAFQNAFVVVGIIALIWLPVVVAGYVAYLAFHNASVLPV